MQHTIVGLDDPPLLSCPQQFATRTMYDVQYDVDFTNTQHRKRRLDVYMPLYETDAGFSHESDRQSAFAAVDESATQPRSDEPRVTSREDDNNNTIRSRGRPVIVFVHGGGWKKGGRRTFGGMHGNVGRSLASRGYIVIVPSYRLSSVHWSMLAPFYALISLITGMIAWQQAASAAGMSLSAAAAAYPSLLCAAFLVPLALCAGAQTVYHSSGHGPLLNAQQPPLAWIPWGKRLLWPAHGHDIGMCVGWVARHIGSIAGGDPTRIALVGHSAGGHIVSMLTLQPERFLQPYLPQTTPGHVALQQPWDRYIRCTAVLSGVLSGRMLCPASLEEQHTDLRALWTGSLPASLQVPQATSCGRPVPLISPVAAGKHRSGVAGYAQGFVQSLALAFRRGMYQHAVFGHGGGPGQGQDDYELCFPLEYALRHLYDCILHRPSQSGQDQGQGSLRYHARWTAGAGAGRQPLPLPPMLFVNAAPGLLPSQHQAEAGGMKKQAVTGTGTIPRSGSDWTLDLMTDAWEGVCVALGLHRSIGQVAGDTALPGEQQGGQKAHASAPLISRLTLLGTDHVGYILGIGQGVPHPTPSPVSPAEAPLNASPVPTRRSGSSSSRGGTRGTVGEHVLVPHLCAWLEQHL